MVTTFSEANYEEAVLELFRNMGYQYAYGPNVERDFQSPLYDEVLLEYIYRLNPALPAEAINEAVYKLKNYENGELVQKNEIFMDYLQNGIEVRYNEQGEEKNAVVYLVEILTILRLLWQISGRLLKTVIDVRILFCS